MARPRKVVKSESGPVYLALGGTVYRVEGEADVPILHVMGLRHDPVALAARLAVLMEREGL